MVNDKTLAKLAANYLSMWWQIPIASRRERRISLSYAIITQRKVDEVIASLYQRMWDGSWVPSLLAAGVDTMKWSKTGRIPYLDARSEDSIQKFARSIKPLLMENRENRTRRGEG